MSEKPPQAIGSEYESGRLTARPQSVSQPAPTGLQPLGLVGKRDGLLFVPSGYKPESPAPLVLMLHGAGGNAHNGLNPFQYLADKEGMILLAIDSRYSTWDMIEIGEYGPDAAFIDSAIENTFARYNIDPTRIAVEGFSDGASYALSLGISNGDLFTHILAFSPGFMSPAARVGSPAIYISHGTHDTVLPIDRCSRRIVPQLERVGYDVFYHEFDGPHTVPPEISREAADRFTQKKDTDRNSS